MDNTRFLNLLRVCGKLDGIGNEYIKSLERLDIALDKIWGKLEKLDESKTDEQLVVGIILNIKDIYNRSYYNDKMNLTEFADKYIETERSKFRYERKRGSITHNIFTESAFLSTRYIGDLDNLKVLIDDNFIGMMLRLDGRAIGLETCFKDNKTSTFIRKDTKEDMGCAVFIKDGKIKNIGVTKGDDYKNIVLALLDSETYDVAMMSALTQVAKQSIVSKALNTLDLSNNDTLKILNMFNIIENENYGRDGDIQSKIKDSEFRLTRLIYSLLFKCYMNIKETLSSMSALLNKEDISQEKIDAFVEVIEVYANCFDNQLRLNKCIDLWYGSLEHNLYDLKNVKVELLERLSTDKYVFRVRNRTCEGTEFLMLDIYGKNKAQKSIIQDKRKLIGINKDGTIDFNVNGNEKDYVVTLY